ncbi:MAG: hypothetical protein ABL973_13845 [Micropepsaceae bacterium]
MRDVLAIIGVIVCAVCVGVTSAYLSVDLTPPGLNLIRPPKPAILAQLRLEAHQNTVQAEASECKYCVAVADLAQTFAKHAKNARQQATSLRESIALDRAPDARRDELKKAERSADGAEAAAAALTSWASRCKSEEFCRTPVHRAASAACNGNSTTSVAAAVSLAAAVRRASSGCAAAACPSIDCQASASLRSDAQYVERSLGMAGGRYSIHVTGRSASELPVGASTLSAEIKGVADETIYVTKMLPLLVDSSSANTANGQLPKLASGMVDERAVSAAQLAGVMEHAAEIGGSGRSDLRNEAAWRLKSLAANLASLGKETQAVEGSAMNWRAATDSLGAALIDVARMQAMLDRASDASSGATGCDISAPAAAQQLREAMAMLDLCRMRSACASKGSSLTNASASSPVQVASRAQSVAERLIVQEVGSPDVVDASENSQSTSPIDVLRSQYGVCTRAAELREASAAAPAAAQAVAEGIAPAVQPAAAPLAPQDLVSGAVNSALNVSAPAETPEPSVVQTSAPASPGPSTDEVIPTAAPAGGTPPAFSGNLLTPTAPTFVGSDGQPVNSISPARPRGH